MTERGVHYARVSKEDQVRGASLEQQDEAASDWFRRNRVQPVRFFRDEGESARTRKRTQLQAALAFVRAEKAAGRPIHVFLVHDLSRFSRNVEDQIAIRRELRDLGVRLDSVMMELHDTAHGKATANFIGVANELESDLKSEKISACMLVRARQGRWLHPAPVGYRNRRAEDDSRRWIEPDPVMAPIVRQAFESFARGERICDVLAAASASGLRGRNAGKPLTMRTFRDLLKHPIYVGKVRSTEHGFVVEGQHEAIVDAGTFKRVQARLEGRPSAAAPRVHDHPDFPLRGFVRCERCGKPLTASWSTGRSGKRYAFYHCWAAGCRAVNVSAGKLEDAFCAELDRQRVDASVFPLVRLACEAVAAESAKTAQQARARAGKRLLELRGRRDRLIEAFIYERALSRELYDGQMQRLEREIAEAELEPLDFSTEAGRLQRMLKLAEPMLTGPSALWREAPYGARRGLQGLIYPSGMQYGPEGLGTAEVSCLFSALRVENAEENRMVARTGFEPVLPA